MRRELLILAVFMAGCSGSAVGPGPDVPPEPPVPAREPTLKTIGWFSSDTLADGLIHYHMKDKEPVTGLSQCVNVLEVDLGSGRYTVDFDYENIPDSLSSVVALKKAVAGVNATFEMDAVYVRVRGYNWAGISLQPGHLRYWKHEGALISDGDSLRIVRGEDGRLLGSDGEKAKNFYASLPEENIYASGPVLIEDYGLSGTTFVEEKWTADEISALPVEDYRRHSSLRCPRTAVALTGDGHLLLVVVDGRHPGKAVGMNIKELTLFIDTHFHPKWALNMDGGGSSAMAISGRGDESTHIVNHPSDNGRFDAFGQRKYRTLLLVKERSGTY